MGFLLVGFWHFVNCLDGNCVVCVGCLGLFCGVFVVLGCFWGFRGFVIGGF